MVGMRRHRDRRETCTLAHEHASTAACPRITALCPVALRHPPRFAAPHLASLSHNLRPAEEEVHTFSHCTGHKWTDGQ